MWAYFTEHKQTIVVAIAAFLLGFGFASLSEEEGVPSEDLVGNIEDSIDDVTIGTDFPAFIDEDNDSLPVPLVKPTTGPDASAGFVFEVSNQRAGDSVIVDSVTFPAPRWLAVRESIDGELGKTLGALWLPEGEHANQTIKLLRGTEGGETYYVVLYTDEGDDHVFDLSADKFVMDESGNPAMVTFQTIASASAL